MSKLKVKLKNVDAIESEIVSLQVSASKADPSSTLEFLIGPLPVDASLTAGTKATGNVWRLAESDVVGLRLIPGTGLNGLVPLVVQAVETDSAGKQTTAEAKLTVTIAVLADDALRKRRKSALIPATQAQRFVAVAMLITALVAFFVVWFYLFEQIQNVTSQEFSVSWQQPEGTVLDSGTSSFWHDREEEELRHLGIIDDQSKAELIKLLRVIPAQGEERNGEQREEIDQSGDGDREQGGVQSDDNVVPPQPLSGGQNLESYRNAISELAYMSNKASKLYLVWLFLIAGVSGMIGVQARAIGNFIYIACFSNVLDLRRFWPWYVMRPALGFILGATIVLLVESSLFVPGDGTGPRGTLWWLAVAFVVGFGADDFTGRLRLLSQTLFGKSAK